MALEGFLIAMLVLAGALAVMWIWADDKHDGDDF